MQVQYQWLVCSTNVAESKALKVLSNNITYATEHIPNLGTMSVASVGSALIL